MKFKSLALSIVLSYSVNSFAASTYTIDYNGRTYNVDFQQFGTGQETALIGLASQQPWYLGNTTDTTLLGAQFSKFSLVSSSGAPAPYWHAALTASLTYSYFVINYSGSPVLLPAGGGPLAGYLANFQPTEPAGDTFYLLYVLGPIGPSPEDTQLSLQNTANYLQGVYSLQNNAIVTGLTYDCTLFDKNNICVSAGGRYDRVNTGGVNASNGLLVGAYRLSDRVRIGAWVDQNLSVNTNNGIQLNNGSPMFGVFGVWNQNASGAGLETKFAAGYGNKDMTVTRQVVGTSEAGSGSTKLNTQGASITVSYNMPVGTMWTASPYAGVRYTRVKANGYTEATTDVTAPLTYAALTQESYTALAGLKLMGRVASKVGTFISAGVEQDFRNRGNNYSVTGVDGLTDIAFNSNIKKTRPTASLGAWYDIDKAQRISLSGMYRTEAFSSVNSLSGMLTYTTGF